MNQKDYIEIEGYHLSYLNVFAKQNSDYYIYSNGLINDTQKIAAKLNNFGSGSITPRKLSLCMAGT